MRTDQKLGRWFWYMLRAALLVWLFVFVMCPGLATAATLLPNGEQTFVDANGSPLAAGTVQFYIPSTTTPKATWKDAGQSTLNTNPVVLDLAGRAIIYGAGTYRQVVKDVNGVAVWDQVTSDGQSTGNIIWSGTSTGSANAQVVAATGFTATDGQVIGFRAGFSNNSAFTLNGGTGVLSVVKDTFSGSVALTGSEIITGNDVYVVYDGNSGNFHIINLILAANPVFTGITTATITVTGAATLAGPVRNTGVISPTALAAQTNDWSPTGLATANTIRASASPSEILTGIVAQPAGTLLSLQNIGVANITLSPFNVASAAANRFVLASEKVLAPGQSVVLQYDSASSGWRNAGGEAPLPAGTISGCTMSYSSATVFGVAACYAANDNQTTGQVNIIQDTVFTKTSATWAAGTGLGCLDTGAVANATWYSVFAIVKVADSSVDYVCSATATPGSGPTLMPTGYTAYRRIGSVLTNGSAQIIQWTQSSDRFLWNTPAIDIDATNPGTAAVTRVLSTPNGVVTTALITTGPYLGTSSSIGELISSLATADVAPTVAATAALAGAATVSGSSGGFVHWELSDAEILTNTSSQVRSRLSASGAGDHIGIITRGWLDTRGR